jgi:type II secretory pathway pseudopilin PulG
LAQQVWTYIGDKGKQFNIGLYHDPKTAHLLVYVNQAPVIVDFNVRNAKSYPLFLDDDFCELKIETENDRFNYIFEINSEADTPKNRARKKTRKKHWRQTLLFFGSFLVIAILVAVLLVIYNKNQKTANKDSLLQQQGLEAIARIDEVGVEGDHNIIEYSFISNGQATKAILKQPKEKELHTPFGMPIQKGDEFTITYVSTSPLINTIDFANPTSRQIDAYKQMSLQQHLALHPELTQEVTECLINLAYELNGLQGLSNFYHQNTSIEENPIANELTYKRLIRDIPFQTERKRRCY